MLGLSKEVTKDDRGLFGFSELHTWAEIAREAARYRDIAAEQLQEPAQCRSMAFYIWYQVRAWLSLHLEHSNSIGAHILARLQQWIARSSCIVVA